MKGMSSMRTPETLTGETQGVLQGERDSESVGISYVYAILLAMSLQLTVFKQQSRQAQFYRCSLV